VRKRMEFNVISNQIEVDYVNVVQRGRGFLVVEIGTAQKYPKVLGYSGEELHLTASEHTPERHLEGRPDNATTIVFPATRRGWQVISADTGRYSLTFALYKEPLRRKKRNLMVERTDAWRVSHWKR
jgi:hypothetical protein